jgi:tetratricopeptide (TPR) repeat protein
MNKKKTDDIFGELASFSITPKPLSIEEQRMAKQNLVPTHQKATSYQPVQKPLYTHQKTLSLTNDSVHDQKSTASGSHQLQYPPVGQSGQSPATPVSKAQYTVVPGMQQHVGNLGGYSNYNSTTLTPMQGGNQYNTPTKLPYGNQSDFHSFTAQQPLGSSPNSISNQLNSYGANQINSNPAFNSLDQSANFDFDFLGSFSSAKKSVGGDLMGNYSGTKKPVGDDDDDILGALSRPATVKTQGYDQFEHETDLLGDSVQMNYAKTRASNQTEHKSSLSPGTNSIQEEDSLQSAIEELVKMGFDRKLSKQTLLANNKDIQKSVDLILNPKSAESPEVEELLKMGFKRPQCLQALEMNKGNLDDAIAYLLKKPNRRVSFEQKQELNVSDVAQQFGISFLSKAKNVFNYSKKKVDSIVKSGPIKEVEPENWNNPSFKDDFKRKESKVIHSPEVELKVDLKPFSPSQGDDELETPLEKKISGKVVEMDLLSMDSSNPNLFTVESKFETTFLASKPVENPAFFVQKQKSPLIADSFHAEADEFRNQGNELFKQGQFGDAEEKYTKGISILPKNHSQLIPLLNNRAACRLKNGDYRGSIQDCDFIINLQNDVKALLRRAMAYEALEDWANARDNYKRIMAIDPTVKGCSLGLSRCISALTPKE